MNTSIPKLTRSNHSRICLMSSTSITDSLASQVVQISSWQPSISNLNTMVTTKETMARWLTANLNSGPHILYVFFYTLLNCCFCLSAKTMESPHTHTHLLETDMPTHQTHTLTTSHAHLLPWNGHVHMPYKRRGGRDQHRCRSKGRSRDTENRRCMKGCWPRMNVLFRQ